MAGMYAGERLNSMTHAGGLVLALAGCAWLLDIGLRVGQAHAVGGMAVFGACSVLLYGASALYHGTRGALKPAWLRVDHAVIHLQIAATYTPFALLAASNWADAALLALVWMAALGGMWRELARRDGRPPRLAGYLVCGWMASAGAALATLRLGAGAEWLLAGALVYTVGTVFHANAAGWRHAHGAWHVFVVAGNACHFVSVAEILPRAA